MTTKSKNKLLYATLIIAIAAFALSAIDFLYAYHNSSLSSGSTSFGSTLTGIDKPLSPQELSIINNAPESDFEIAGQKLLNGTLNNTIVLSSPPQNSPFIVNGKPSVIYIGAISCIYCGENRWAMALALSRFGNFSALYTGYSSFGDGDVPTLYWNLDNYTVSQGATYGNFYHSSSINFFSVDYDSPIRQGFEFPSSGDSISYFVANAPNATYREAMELMNKTNDFKGTPFTFWGSSINVGADGIVFGNSSQFSGDPPLTEMTHAQVFSQLSNFNDQFSWSEYAAADVYVAELCASLNNSTQVCELSAIKGIESRLGL